jgi:hypothetical protein
MGYDQARINQVSPPKSVIPIYDLLISPFPAANVTGYLSNGAYPHYPSP